MIYNCNYIHIYGIVSAKREPSTCFFKFNFFRYSRSLKCPLHIASYALRIRVSVMKLQDTEFLISHTVQRKHYILKLRVLETL